MLDLVTTSFYIKAPEFRKQEFEQYSTELFDAWDKYVEDVLNLPDYSLTLVIEEGSIKGNGKIAASAAVLYFAIGSYGDFISGLHIIKEQATFVTSALFEQAKRTFGCRSTKGNSKQSRGEVFYLESLFERVQRGIATPDQAMDELRLRWRDEAITPKFLQDIASNLADAPRYPEQLTLADDSWEGCSDVGALEREPIPRIPRPPDIPIPQHYRIEIYRQSKSDKRKVKLTKVK